jgi:hypothetical protein
MYNLLAGIEKVLSSMRKREHESKKNVEKSSPYEEVVQNIP